MIPFSRPAGYRMVPALAVSLALVALDPAHAGDDPVMAIQQQTFVTADTSPDACDRATQTLITVEEDTVVQYCFTVRNVGTVTLTAHDLVTDAFGKLDSMLRLTLTPGQSAWRSRLDVAQDDRTTTSTWIARDVAPEYAWSAIPYAFTDISTTGDRLSLSNFFAQTVTLPFPVRLYGKSSPYLSVCNLGTLELDTFRGLCSMTPGPLPNDGQPLSMLPYWDELYWNLGGIWWQRIGNEPNRRVIVQWQRGRYPFLNDDGNGITFQVVLYENSDLVDFQYKDVSFGLPGYDAGGTATIGMNYDANLGQTYSFRTASLVDQQAIRWTPNVWRTTQAASSATVVVHAAKIAVGAGAVQSAQAPGRVVERRVPIASTGLMPLRWNVGEAQTNSTAHIPKHERPFVAKRDREVLAPPRETAPRRPMPLMATPPRAPGSTLPVAYGRDNTNEDFVRIDLADGAVTGINTVQSAPISQIDFRDGDFSTLYSLTGGLGSQALISVDTASGTFTYLKPSDPRPGEAWSGQAFDSSNGMLYGSAVDFFSDHNGVSYCGPDSWLYRVNPAAGTPRLIGRIAADACVMGIATNANGEMFGVDTQNDTLLAIDKTTGAGTVIGPLGFDATHDVGLDVDESANVLYLTAWNAGAVSSELRTVNTLTGATTLVAQFQRPGVDFADIVSLAIASGGGGCADPASVPWLSVSPASGTLEPGTSDAMAVRLDSTGLAAGRYDALLCVFSNDPRRRFVTLPVRLDVDPDAIFRDGFE